jgi:hypothetical protein
MLPSTKSTRLTGGWVTSDVTATKIKIKVTQHYRTLDWSTVGTREGEKDGMDDTHSVKGMGVYSPVRSLVFIPTVSSEQHGETVRRWGVKWEVVSCTVMDN